ncbi:MAG: S41 family peptidase [Clostridiales bacterium]|nr:S41 family peptidase [Clostridiales bacterium]
MDNMSEYDQAGYGASQGEVGSQQVEYAASPVVSGSPQDPGNEKKRRGNGSFWLGMACGVVIAVIVVMVVSVRTTGGFASGTDKLLTASTVNKINTLADYIEENYYEDVDIEDLRNGLYEGLFDNLDIYSSYYTEEEYNELLEDTLEGTYCGIGASLQQDAETMTVTVIRVYDGSPAKEAGLMAGDIIYQVDDYDATAMELSELVTHIRGEEETTVHLVTYRNGEEIEYDIERKNMAYPTVVYDMLEENVGYIEVSEFAESTEDQFREALTDLEDQGMDYLIVDLRDNPGGVLTTVCNMLDMILPDGLLLYTEDRDGNREEYTSGDDEFLDIPLAVLVNGNSASASEIFAGAVQDREAGIIIGTTTFGKGVVQSVRTFKDGTAFKLTTSRYFTPGGTCIQDIGITPDDETEYEFLGGEDDTYSYDLDNQIQEAIKRLTE